MSQYRTDLIEVVSTYRSEIERDLSEALAQKANVEVDLTAAVRQVAMLEGLLALGPDSPGVARREAESEGLTLHGAMARVLSTAPERMMRAADLARLIEQRGLYRMRNGRAVEAGQIHARVAHYPALFRKQGTFIELVGSTAE